MKDYYKKTDSKDRPHIVGLTASPTDSDKFDENKLNEIEETYDAKLYRPWKYDKSIRLVAPHPAEILLFYGKFISFILFFSFYFFLFL